MFSSGNFAQNFGKISVKICANLPLDKKCGRWYNRKFDPRQPPAGRQKLRL